jgi:NAD(P)H-flavin reductase
LPTPEHIPETVINGRAPGGTATGAGAAGGDGAAGRAALSSPAMSNRLYDALVEETEPLSDWVLRMRLKVESQLPFHFEPGQYVSLHQRAEGQERIRHFSIASLPAGDNRIELCVGDTAPLAKEGGTVPKPGDVVRVSAPGGSFRLAEPLDGDLVFIATGTGISPFRPMIARALEVGTKERVTLLFGVRAVADILFRAEFDALAASEPRFRFLPTLSRPDPDWKGLTGYVQAHLDLALGGRSRLDAYLCGRKDMINAVRPLLAAGGVSSSRIYYEKYA